MPPKRQLGLVSALALVVANMVGSGVFTTSGLLLRDLGSPLLVLVTWLAAGILTVLGAVSYGALAKQFPESGGEYVFLSRTLHPAAGYVAGWVSLLVGFSAPTAAVALAFSEYVKQWLPGSVAPQVTGSCVIAALALLHATHVRRGAWVQNAAVLIKLLLILIFLGWAGPALHHFSSSNLKVSAGGFAVAMVWTSFSYSGWNAVIYIAGEISSPERNLRLAMTLGTIVVTILYVMLNTVFVFAAPIDELAGKIEIGRTAAEALGGQRLGDFVTALIALALATCISSMMMAGPRVYARMADDGYLPGWFGYSEQGPPRKAILLQAAIALVMLWTATFQSLLTYIGFTLGLCTGAAVLGLIRLRYKRGEQVIITGWPWVPYLFVVTLLAISALTFWNKPIESAIAVGTLVLGWLAWHLAYARH